MKLLTALFALALAAGAVFGQNAALMPPTRQQFFDQNGKPLAGGYVYTCVAGSTCAVTTPGQPPSNPQATYTDSTASVQNPNPVVLDTAGRATVWIGASPYKIVATNYAGVQQWTVDNVQNNGLALSGSLLGPNGATLVNYTASGAGAVPRTVASKLGDTVNVLDYGAKCDGATDDTAAIQAAINATAGSTSGVVLFPLTSNYCLISAGLQIQNRTGLTLTSANSTVIRFRAGVADVQYAAWPSFGQDSIIRVVTSSNIVISNLTLDGNLPNRTAHTGGAPVESLNSDVTIAGSNNVTVDRCILINGMTDGVDVMSYYPQSPLTTVPNTNIFVTNNTLTNNRRNNISVVAGQHTILRSNNLSGAGTVQGTPPEDGIDIEPSNGATDIQDLLVEGNSSTGNAAQGIQIFIPAGLPVSNVRILGNYAGSNGTFGINSENDTQMANAGQNVSIVGNHAANNGATGIRVYGQSANLVGSNVVTGNAVGIALLQVANLLVSGNTISANLSDGVEIGSATYSLGFTSATLAGNVIFDNANATSLTNGTGFAVNAWGNSASAALTLSGNTFYSSPTASVLMRGAQLSGSGVATASANTNFNLNTDHAVFSGAWTLNPLTGLNVQDLSQTALNVVAGPNQTNTPIQNWRYNNGNAAASLLAISNGFDALQLFRSTDGVNMGQLEYAGSNAAGSRYLALFNSAADYLSLDSENGPLNLTTSGVVRVAVDSSGNVTDNGTLLVPAQKANSGTRYACFTTTGQLVSQTTACSGT